MQLEEGNLEEALSRLRKIAALLRDDQTIDDLTATRAKELDQSICEAIIVALDIEAADLRPVQLFAMWAGRAGYRTPLEVFTVNYDLLLESAFEQFGIPYFDGFIGSLQPRFQSDLLENALESTGELLPSSFVRLWKLHGSVNWVRSESNQIVRLGHPVAEGSPAAIYPSDEKYEESRRVPFVVLQDRFRRALHHPETLAIIAGYSFGDAHLNEMIFDAAFRRPRSEFVVFCYSSIPESLAQKAELAANIQVVTGEEAILGGVRANWGVPELGSSDLWEEGSFSLRDFTNLAGYLARSSTSASEPKSELQVAIQNLVEEAVSVVNLDDDG